jgi:hypothetical protein
MLRARFQANYEDYRPVKWPPPGPYWCSGYAGDETYSIVIAYINNEDEIIEFWPEASAIDVDEVKEIIFTERFACPDWWPKDKLILEENDGKNAPP